LQGIKHSIYSERVLVANERGTAKFSCTRAPSVLGTHFQRYRIAPDVHGPLDDSGGICEKFDYVELRNGA
jgi:hypothetical protein